MNYLLHQKLSRLCVVLISFVVLRVFANDEPFRWTYKINNSLLEIIATVAENHYLYSERTSVELSDEAGNLSVPTNAPLPKEYQDEFGENHKIYPPGNHSWSFSAPQKNSKLKIEFQGCAKNPFMCFPPKKLSFTITEAFAGKSDSLPLPYPAQSQTQQDKEKKQEKIISERSAKPANFAENLIAKGGIFLIFGAFLGGLLSTLTPCVLPMIPITLAILGSNSGESGKLEQKTFLRALLYVIGIIITFTSLALLASLSGKALGAQILGNPIILAIFAILFVLLAISMLGLYDIDLPSSWRLKLDKVGGGTNTGAFLMGLVAGFIAVPCTGPILATLLGIAAISGNVFVSLALFSSYATGFGLPFLIIGSGISRTPKSGPYMDKIKSVLGVLILTIANFAIFMAFPKIKHSLGQFLPEVAYLPVILTSLGFLLGAIHSDGHSPYKIVKTLKVVGAILLSFAIYWSIDAPAKQKQHTDIGSINWRYSYEEALSEAKAENKNLLLDFGAEWCTACREMDSFTFTNPDVIKTVNETKIPVKIDATILTPEIEKLIEKYAVKGFPTFIIVAPDEKTIKQSTGFMPAEDFLVWLDEK